MIFVKRQGKPGIVSDPFVVIIEVSREINARLYTDPFVVNKYELDHIG